MLGYVKRKLLLKEVLAKDEVLIKLKPAPLVLKEVIIKNNTNIKTIGNKSKSFGFVVSLNSENLGGELLIRLRASSKGSIKVLSFNTHIAYNSFDYLKFRIKFYDIKDGLPYKSLINQNIYLELKDKNTGFISKRLDDFGVIIKDDFALGLELVEVSSDDGKVEFSGAPSLVGKPLFFRETHLSKWIKVNIMTIGFNIDVTKEK